MLMVLVLVFVGLGKVEDVAMGRWTMRLEFGVSGRVQLLFENFRGRKRRYRRCYDDVQQNIRGISNPPSTHEVSGGNPLYGVAISAERTSHARRRRQSTYVSWEGVRLV